MKNGSTRGRAHLCLRAFVRLYTSRVCLCTCGRGIPGRHPRLVVARSINLKKMGTPGNGGQRQGVSEHIDASVIGEMKRRMKISLL